MTRAHPLFLACVLSLATPACAEVVVDDIASEPTSYGYVQVFQVPPQPPGSSKQSYLTAWFGRGIVDVGEPIEREGRCSFMRSDRRLHTLPPSLDAGSVRVTGGLMTIVAEHEQGGYQVYPKGPIFEVGDPVTMQIDGSDALPAAEATMTVPPVPVMAPAPAQIAQQEDFTFTWTSPPGVGKVSIEIHVWPESWAEGDVVRTGDVEEVLRCDADLSAGKLTVPASLLEELTPSTVRGAELVALVSQEESRDAGDIPVRLRLSMPATRADGNDYHAFVELK